MLSSWAAFNGTSANGNDSSSFFLLSTAMCCGHWYHVSQVALLVKNPSADAGNIRDVGSIPWSGRSPGGGHGNPLQYSCPENPMDRRAWQATVHWVAKNRTQLKQHSLHAHIPNIPLESSLALSQTAWEEGHCLPSLPSLAEFWEYVFSGFLGFYC